MIVAGLALLAVGAADLVRQFVPLRWIGYASVAVLLLVVAGFSDALLPAIIAIGIAAIWVWSMPTHRESRATFWPAVLLAVLCVAAVALLEPRADAGLIGHVWDLRSPFGPVSFDLAILTIGVTAFLLESSNLVVRAALAGEHTWRPDESRGATGGSFKGGRLIGPLERLIVFMLTLTAAYTLLAAMLAAKGIVRFPEISKDGETGARAEYFLVGSLVSWLSALGAAFLVWWAMHS